MCAPDTADTASGRMASMGLIMETQPGERGDSDGDGNGDGGQAGDRQATKPALNRHGLPIR
jgi:hypothetical protein